MPDTVINTRNLSKSKNLVTMPSKKFSIKTKIKNTTYKFTNKNLFISSAELIRCFILKFNNYLTYILSLK